MVKLIAVSFAIFAFLSPVMVQAASKQAAVIGNTAYPAAPLANAARDAATVAEALAQNGFEVRTYFDVPIAEMEGVLAEIKDQFASADISVLYYAGHAFQFDGQNQILAVDVEQLTRAEIESRVVSLGELLEATVPGGSGQTGQGLRLVIIDACRNDPFSPIDQAFETGITFEESGDTQTLISYSTSAGQLAADGPAGGNGPYAIAFARALRKQDATLSSTLRSVRRDVRISSTGLQIPWVVGSVEDDPVLSPTFIAEAATPIPDSETPSLDEIVWAFVQDDLTASTLRGFAISFPASRHAEDAVVRVRKIEEQKTEAKRQLSTSDGLATGQTLAEIALARQRFDQSVTYRPNSNIPAELFGIWPKDLPKTENGLHRIVNQCDRLAADPADPQRVAPPVRGGLVNIREAARACGYALADDPDNPRLLFQFGRVLQLAGRHDWARTYYLRSSAFNYSAALTNMGFMAIRGIGQEKDFDAAAKFYRQAAELGNLRARTNIGTMFIKGTGMDAAPQEGVLWYRLASGMGWANAQNALADLYRKGTGVEKDMQASAALYHLAAENGQRAAMNSLGRSYLAGWGVEPDRPTAYRWFDRAIAAGDRFAPLFLGRDLIKTGEVEKDPQRVVGLFELSAQRGFGNGYAELSKLYRAGEFVERDNMRAYFYARLAELKKVKKSEELVEKTKAKLNEAEIAQVEDEIARTRRLNGI